MPTLTKLILFFVVGLPLLVFSQKEKSTPDYLQEGKSFIHSNPEKAIELLEKAMRQAQSRDDDELYINSLSALSSIDYTNLQAQNKSVASWMKEAVHHKRNLNSLALSDVYYFLGIYYSDYTSETDSALFNINKALLIRIKLAGERTELVAQCYHALGDLYKYAIFDYSQAEMYYEKSLQIREQIKSTDRLALASNYYNLATTNRSQRDFEKALSYGINAIRISQEIQDLIMQEMSYTMVANIHRDMGNTDQAIQFYTKAIALNISSHRVSVRLAWSYIGMGETFKNDAVWDQALLNFSKAEVIYKQNENHLTESHKQLWVYCQFQIAETYLLQKKIKQTFRMIQIHHATLRRLNMAKGRLLAESYALSGNYYLEIHKPDSALYFYQRALSAAIPAFTKTSFKANPTENEIHEHYYVYQILLQKAKAFDYMYSVDNDQQNLKLAIDCTILAEKLLTLERSTLDIEESKWRFSDDTFDVYEYLVSLLFELQKNKPSDSIHAIAFEYLERSKARTLSDILTHGEQQKAMGSGDTLLILQGELKLTWFSLQHQLALEQEKSNAVSDKVSALQQKLVATDRSLQHNKALMEIKYPGYFRIKYNQKIPLVYTVQQGLENKSMILEFFFGSENVYALAIDKTTILFKKIARTDSVENQIVQLMHHFSDDHSSLNRETFLTFSKSTHELYQLLLSPFQSMLSGKNKIQVIPDGLISQIPFEILTVESSFSSGINYRTLKYALREYSFGYAYSTSLLVGNSHPAIHNPTLLAMGFTGGQSLRSALDSRLSDIDGARLELSELKTQFKNGRFLLGNDVSESNFKQLAPGFDIIHLAIHGQGNPEDQYASSLYFRNQADSVNDGELHAYEIYGLTIRARLAVLTACESGLGKAYKGEGMMSIASAFSYSGCQNVLMSLWKVNDQASVGLMTDFYKQLLDGNSVDEALMMAKKNYLEHADELTADPKIWAPLVAYGDLQPIVSKERSSIRFLIPGIAATILLLVFIRIWKKKYAFK